jgi:DNA polymerase elongation subunit (family B)
MALHALTLFVSYGCVCAALQVIYGDTDSIMIATGTTDVAAARDLGQRIKREVNKR